jgi:hypothetical protein
MEIPVFRKLIPLPAAVLAFILTSCTKKDIQFGNSLAESYTKVIQTDTVDVNMSTYEVDSFPTNSMGDFLIGNYKDPVMGSITTKPFFQLGIPSDLAMEDNAIYDSLTLVIKPGSYYYGDTTKGQTLTVRQLAAPIVYSYGTYLYNTSTIAEMPSVLGSKYIAIRPSSGDSISIKLDDNRGMDLFNKLKQGAVEVSTANDFLNYFNGLSIGATGIGAVYRISASADSVFMRLHYHITIPYPTQKYKDFAYNSTMYFNQILSDRIGTELAQLQKGYELPSASSGSIAFTQPGAGVLMKITFPTLRNILEIDPTVKLLKATLILRTANGTYNGLYKLPPSLYLAQTNGTNTIGTAVLDSAGTSVLYSTPAIDNIYSTSASYSFSITSYINSLLTTSGVAGNGFFIMNASPGSSASLDRAVFNSTAVQTGKSQLVLSLITLKN